MIFASHIPRVPLSSFWQIFHVLLLPFGLDEKRKRRKEEEKKKRKKREKKGKRKEKRKRGKEEKRKGNHFVTIIL